MNAPNSLRCRAARVALAALVPFAAAVSLEGAATFSRKVTFAPDFVNGGTLMPYGMAGGAGYVLNASGDSQAGTTEILIRYDANGNETGNAELFVDSASSLSGMVAVPDTPGRFWAGYVHDTGYADIGLFNLGDLSTVFAHRLTLTGAAADTTLLQLGDNRVGVLQDLGASIKVTLFNGATGALVFEQTYTSSAFLAPGGFLSGQSASLSALPDNSGYLLEVSNYQADLGGGAVAYENTVVLAVLNTSGAVVRASQFELTTSGPTFASASVLEDDSVLLNITEQAIDMVTQDVTIRNHVFNLLPNGSLRWSRIYTGASLNGVHASAPNGDLYLTGYLDTSNGMGDSADGVIVRIDDATGAIVAKTSIDLGDGDFVFISDIDGSNVYAAGISSTGQDPVTRLTLLKLALDLGSVSTAVEYSRDVDSGFLMRDPGTSNFLFTTFENGREVGAITLSENFTASLGCSLFTNETITLADPAITEEANAVTPTAPTVNATSSTPTTGAGTFSLAHTTTTTGDICGTSGGGAPVVNSTLTANGTVGVAFNYTITATNSPTSFNATNLPDGLSVNTGTGAITGTPTSSGVTNVTISATNATGTGQASLQITILGAVPPAPVINSTLTANGTVGVAFNYTITATNTPTSFNATGLPAGLSVNTGTGAITGTPTTAGAANVTISATNAGGTDQETLVITIASATAPGQPGTPTATPTQFDSFTAQWSAVAGATGYRLDVATDATFTTFVSGYQDLDVGNVTSRIVTGLRLGSYYVRVRAYSGGGTSASSSTYSVAVGSRLLNLSTRGQSSSTDPMIVGFYVAGAPKTLLIRVAANALASLGVPGTMPNPRLRLVDGAQNEVAANDDWNANDPAVIAAVTASGAGLQFAPGSLDSVIVAQNLPAGGYTAVVETVTGAAGVVLVELYEIDEVGRLTNISTRGYTVSAGSDVMIPGTFIGPTSKRVLVRVVGPTLGQYVAGTLADPILEIYNGDNAPGSPPIFTNDDWDVNDAALLATWTQGNPNQVAGLALLPASKDAAMLVTLPKNNSGYTVLAKGKDGAAGTVLVEVYEVP